MYTYSSLRTCCSCCHAQIVSSSYTAAAYLSSIGFGQSRQPGKHVLLLGSQGTADELAAAGLQVLDAQQLQLPVLESVEAMLQMQVGHCQGQRQRPQRGLMRPPACEVTHRCSMHAHVC
jgi:hypothetical protein